jgi:hypothetical protein
MGVRLTNGALDLRWTKNSSTNTSYYALGARGTASLVGISSLTLTGSLQAERNTGPGSVTLDFGTASTSDDLTLESGAKRFGGSAQLSISGFVDISGSFGFEETTETVDGVERTRIKVAAAGTHPFSDWQAQLITPNERYDRLIEEMRDVARSNLIFGLHVHVGISSRNEGIHIMNAVRYFLPHIYALSTNSPFWCGRNTGFKSYRSKVFDKFPRTGIPDFFSSAAEYDEYIALLVKTGCIDNGKKIYNDHYFNSIQDFISRDVLEKYLYRQDVNMANDNIWQTKLMVRPMGPENYLLDPRDVNHPEIQNKMRLLNQEMREVFHLN